MVAQDELRSALDTIQRALSATASNNASFGQAITLHLTEKARSWKPATKELYQRVADDLRDLWGDLRLESFNRSHGVALLNDAPNPTAGRNRLVLANAIWRTAQRNDLTARPLPWQGLVVPATHKNDRWLTEGELSKLWATISEVEHRWCSGCLKAIRLLILTGARVSEITSLRYADVDYERKVLRLRDSKTGPREMPVGARVVAMLKADAQTTWVCQRRRSGKPVLRGDVYRMLTRLCDRAGLKGVSPHTLRHTFVTHALIAGVPIEHVRVVVGHSTNWMTSRYGHLTDKHAQQAADLVSERLHRSRK